MNEKELREQEELRVKVERLAKGYPGLSDLKVFLNQRIFWITNSQKRGKKYNLKRRPWGTSSKMKVVKIKDMNSNHLWQALGCISKGRHRYVKNLNQQVSLALNEEYVYRLKFLTERDDFFYSHGEK
jgi:hypothetical protein